MVVISYFMLRLIHLCYNLQMAVRIVEYVIGAGDSDSGRAEERSLSMSKKTENVSS